MEEYYKARSEPESDSDDAISLCDLLLQNVAVSETGLDSLPPHSPDFFEFAVGNSAAKSASTVPIRSQDPFLSRSESFDGRVVSRSSSSSRSGNSGRKHRVLFGLAKFPAEMELADMRKRQSRIAPAPMFPADMSSGGAGGGSRWSLLRLLRCRAHSASALARASIGRMRLV